MITGNCNNCSTSRQDLWCFQNDVIAVPKKGVSAAGLAGKSLGYEKVLRSLQALGLPNTSIIWPRLAGDYFRGRFSRTMKKRCGTMMARKSPFPEDLRETLPKESRRTGWLPVEILSVMLALIGVFGL